MHGNNGRRVCRGATHALWSFLLCAPSSYAAAGETLDPLQPTGHWELHEFGSAPVPPMGWNSWNAFKTQIDEGKVMGSARAVVATGLRELGYRYINIDDGWWQQRRQPDGRMVIRTSIFPSAAVGGVEATSFRPLVQALHAMDLKAGIYTDIGRNGCSQGYPQPDSLLPSGTVAEREVGLFDHVAHDLSLYFHEWGFDYIKVDGCGLNAFDDARPAVKNGQYRAFPAMVMPDSINATQVADIRQLYGTVRDQLTAVRPDGQFVLSICNWGTANVRAWGRDYGNLWRTSGDLAPRWSLMLYNFDSVVTRELFSGPGHWNDPDMLFVGQGDFDMQHLTEARTHFALWAIEDAPLIIGYDLRKAPRSLLEIWGAAEIVAVNQDAAGNQGVLAYTSDDLQIIVKQLAGRNDKAVVLFNRGMTTVRATLTAAHLKFLPGYPIRVRDLWLKRDLKPFTNETAFSLSPRESKIFKVTGRPELGDGIYLSEMPARIYVAADGIRALQADPQIFRPAESGENGSRGTGTRSELAGWGGPRADSTPYNDELRLRGTAYASGIGALANSRLQVRTDALFKHFTALVGVDDSSLERATKVQFEVYGDGRLLARSIPLGAEDATFRLNADVPGVATLELVAREIGAAHAPTLVTWGAASLR
jgi:alpha-galactosidase